MKTYRTRLLLALALLGLARCAVADEPAILSPKPAELPWEKGSILFGGFVASFDSTVTLGVNNVGIQIKAEDLLDMDSTLTVFRVNALYRPGKTRRNQFDFTYAAYHRSGHTVIDEEITVGDITLPVGAELDSVFNFDIIRGDYTYAILQDDRMRISLGLGVYVVPLKVKLEAETSTGWGTIEATDVTLPMPSLTLRSEFLLVPKLYLNMGVEAMYLKISDFEGSLVDANLALEYRPWKHLGLGVGYNAFTVNVEARAGSDYPGVDFVGDVGVHYGGLLLYGKLMF